MGFEAIRIAPEDLEASAARTGASLRASVFPTSAIFGQRS
jgi:hypothetical protein